ncbi:MAG: ferredoxin [Longimicrobiales bacterium]|nr:ferredoxin [Longimicrobiales bacterium]
MDDETREIAGLTIRIDRLLCVGFEDCIEADTTLFELDDEGIATFHAETDSVDAERILKACRACPVDALEVTDASGRQVVP